MTDEELARLRAELDDVDRDLLERVARRMEIVTQIGRLKAQSGRQVFDRTRERQVLDRTRAEARRLGVPPDLAENLYALMLDASHEAQERLPRAVDVVSRHFLIVGGGGQMGQLLAHHLEGRGHSIEVYEPDSEEALTDMVPRADVVMVAVPMHAATTVAKSVAPHVRADALLCDINSLKTAVCRAMSGAAGEVVGLHPMFGPSVASLRRQKVVVCPVRPGPLTQWLCGELTGLGLELIETTPENHDKMMATVQVLVHFRTLVMGEALRASGVPIEESLAYTSPIYRLELAVVGRLFAQDPDLYAEIEMENPYGEEFRRHFVEATSRVQQIVASGDRQAFRELFSEISIWFAGFSDDAMTLSDTIIDTLVAKA